jgi:hypothetical protein
MDFPINNYRTSEEEVKAILECVAKQIADPKSNETFGEDVVARIFGSERYIKYPNPESRTFNKDAVRRAVREIKQHGWRCWEHTDYEDKLTIWVTASGNRPHPWYTEC